MCQLPRPTLDREISVLNDVPDIVPLLAEFFHTGRLTAALGA